MLLAYLAGHQLSRGVYKREKRQAASSFWPEVAEQQAAYDLLASSGYYLGNISFNSVRHPSLPVQRDGVF